MLLFIGISVTLVLAVALAGYAAAWFVLIGTGNRLTMRQFALREGMHVVDAGCGSGRLTIPVAQQVGPTGEVLGIDIRADKLQRAEARARRAGSKNVRFELTGAGEGKLEPEHFDRALLFAVLGEMTQRETALAEIYQALKPGGILVVTEGFLDPHFQSQERVRQLAHTVGFLEASCLGNTRLFVMNLLKPPPPGA